MPLTKIEMTGHGIVFCKVYGSADVRPGTENDLLNMLLQTFQNFADISDGRKPHTLEIKVTDFEDANTSTGYTSGRQLDLPPMKGRR